MKFLKSNINLVMICAGVLGYILMDCLFFFEEIYRGGSIRTEGNQVLFFNQNPGYLLWLTLTLLQSALWCILLFPATEIIGRLKHELGKAYNPFKTFSILLLAFGLMNAAGGLTIFNYVTEPSSSFNHHNFKLKAYTVIAQVVGIYFLTGIVLVGRKCLRNIEVNNFDISDYKRLRGYQDMLLNFTGLILSLGVITSFLFNKAVLAENKGDIEKFPPAFVISFGLLNTLVLLIFYLPNYFVMLDYGKRIIESKFPLETTDKEIIHANFENQNNLSKNLKLDLSFTESIKKTLIILSPLLSSFLPKLFDLFG